MGRVTPNDCIRLVFAEPGLRYLIAVLAVLAVLVVLVVLYTGQMMGLLNWHCHQFLPVEPNPPAPRSVCSNDSTTTTSAASTIFSRIS